MYNVTCNTDDNYAQHCMAMLCSLFENNKEETIAVHVLCNTLSDVYRTSLKKLADAYSQSIKFYSVDEMPLENVQFRSKRPLTKAAYYRLLLSSILVGIDKVLYLDCDMIILGKIRDLFELELDNYALAAVLDSMPYSEKHQRQLNLPINASCFCSGIMLINLEYWRKHDVESQLLDFARRKRNPIYLHDQDVLNYVLHNQWFMLSPKWNHNPSGISYSICFKPYHNADMIYTPSVIHYCSNVFKPWYKGPCPGRKYYMCYLKLSNYPHPQFVELSFGRYICLHYYYVRQMILKLRPIMPKLIVMLISDVINILRLLCYLLFYVLGKREKFVDKMSNFYVNHRMNY
ncbi:glycosyltransferase family 8 protein [Phocaeicola sp.]